MLVLHSREGVWGRGISNRVINTANLLYRGLQIALTSYTEKVINSDNPLESWLCCVVFWIAGCVVRVENPNKSYL